MADEKLFKDIDEVSRKLDGLSRAVEDIAYRASGKRRASKPEEAAPSASTNISRDAILALAERYTDEFGMSSDQRGSVLHFAKWAQEQHPCRRTL